MIKHLGRVLPRTGMDPAAAVALLEDLTDRVLASQFEREHQLGNHRYSACWPTCEYAAMSSDSAPDVTALAINVTIPERLRWTGTRRGEEFTLTTLNVRLLPDGRLAAKAYGRPAGGGRGTYVSFPVPERPELSALIARAASRAGALWAAHRGLS